MGVSNVSSEVQFVEEDENGKLNWSVQLVPDPNIHGDFVVLLSANNLVYDITTEYEFILSVGSVNDEPVIESFSDCSTIELDEDTVYETSLLVSDLDNLNDVTLHASVQDLEGNELA